VAELDSQGRLLGLGRVNTVLEGFFDDQLRRLFDFRYIA
jgi:hypothetical protein